MEERQDYLRRLILAMGISFLLLAAYVWFFSSKMTPPVSVNQTANVSDKALNKPVGGLSAESSSNLSKSKAMESSIFLSFTDKESPSSVLKIGSVEYVMGSSGRTIYQVYVTDRTGRKPLFEPPVLYCDTPVSFSIANTPRHRDYGGGKALLLSLGEKSGRTAEIIVRGYFFKKILSSYRDYEKLAVYQNWKKKTYSKHGKKTVQGTLEVREKSPIWIALISRYYVFALSWTPDFKGRVNFIWDGQVLRLSLPANAKIFVYAGLRDPSLLKKFGLMLEKSSSLGPFAKAFAYVLRFFHSLAGDWGLAILFLAIFIKLILWPLTHSSLVSAKRMKEIQPKMQELQKKYENNPQKLQQEVTKLYRESGINPASGCLPMLLQIPVFVALYNALRGAIELKGASTFFMPWVPDLSEADPYHVMPILMGVSMILQQWISGQFRDNNTRLFSIVMSVLFVYLFWSFPSGLVFYWFIFNILSLLHQLYVDKRWEKKKVALAKTGASGNRRK